MPSLLSSRHSNSPATFRLRPRTSLADKVLHLLNPNKKSEPRPRLIISHPQPLSRRASPAPPTTSAATPTTRVLPKRKRDVEENDLATPPRARARLDSSASQDSVRSTLRFQKLGREARASRPLKSALKRSVSEGYQLPSSRTFASTTAHTLKRVTTPRRRRSRSVSFSVSTTFSRPATLGANSTKPSVIAKIRRATWIPAFALHIGTPPEKNNNDSHARKALDDAHWDATIDTRPTPTRRCFAAASPPPPYSQEIDSPFVDAGNESRFTASAENRVRDSGCGSDVEDHCDAAADTTFISSPVRNDPPPPRQVSSPLIHRYSPYDNSGRPKARSSTVLQAIQKREVPALSSHRPPASLSSTVPQPFTLPPVSSLLPDTHALNLPRVPSDAKASVAPQQQPSASQPVFSMPGLWNSPRKVSVDIEPDEWQIVVWDANEQDILAWGATLVVRDTRPPPGGSKAFPPRSPIQELHIELAAVASPCGAASAFHLHISSLHADFRTTYTGHKIARADVLSALSVQTGIAIDRDTVFVPLPPSSSWSRFDAIPWLAFPGSATSAKHKEDGSNGAETETDPAAEWRVRFWAPVPLALFGRREHRTFVVRARATVVDWDLPKAEVCAAPVVVGVESLKSEAFLGAVVCGNRGGEARAGKVIAGPEKAGAGAGGGGADTRKRKSLIEEVRGEVM
ncbi:uncharacterized protein BXZ73DRAFT_99945 [Epithele typhae]|uniref:uncharacterized protein n=1 Tax=Epithele typhae TaxID=378194 RepID=UPI0020088ABD|nr:uncharacterized protein BXZ73DRAFT_99945 [Epithele typhae]KAH9938883.1 hypothetical protein BXZ73DRAFT_99945 [Epithele typhae]